MGRNSLTDAFDTAPSHYTGAASELLAAAYCLQQGCQVFWPSVQQGSTDFVLYGLGEFVRVQVKTATWNRSSPPWSYLQCRILGTNKAQDNNWDLLMIVKDEKLWAIPKQSLDSSNISLMSNNPNPRPSRWDVFRMR